MHLFLILLCSNGELSLPGKMFLNDFDLLLDIVLEITQAGFLYMIINPIILFKFNCNLHIIPLQFLENLLNFPILARKLPLNTCMVRLVKIKNRFIYMLAQLLIQFQILVTLCQFINLGS